MGSLRLDSDTEHFLEGDIDYLDRPEHHAAIELAEYWLAKRGDRAMPFRSDIRPTEIPALLPYLIINEVVDNGEDFRIRLYGTELSRLSGEERTGKLISEICGTPETLPHRWRTQARWLEINRRALQTVAPVYARALMLNERNDSRDAHVVALPLTVTGNAVEQILGAIFSVPIKEMA